MRIVAANPTGFAEVVSANCASDNSLFLVHSDGTITRFNDQNELVGIWVNAGKRVSSLTVLDNDLFVGFTDNRASVYSLETGFIMKSLYLSFEVTGLAVFEHVLVGWSRNSSKICLLHRFNFEIFKTVSTESCVVNVFALSGGITVVTSSDVYWLRRKGDSQWKLESIFHTTEAPMIGACALNKRWLLLTPNTWKIMALADKKGPLTDEMQIHSPVDTSFISVSSTANLALIQCTQKKFMIIRDNNIQVLSSPSDGPELLVMNAPKVVTRNLQLFQAICLENNEINWQKESLSASLENQKYLIGQNDSKITAVYEDNDIQYIGTDDGRINGTVVFPQPVTYIDGTKAYSEINEIAMPISPVNLVKPASILRRDSRTTVQITKFEWGSAQWTGITTENGVSLQHSRYENIPLFMAVLLVVDNLISVDKALGIADITDNNISQLEDLAVLSMENTDLILLETTAQFLSRVWDVKRINTLIKAGGPRSLKVLASASTFIDIDRKEILKIINNLTFLATPNGCDAVLWLFEHHYTGINTLPIPFTLLKQAPAARISKLAHSVVTKPDGTESMLKDIFNVFTSDAEYTVAERMALALLLATLELPPPLSLPQTETQLVSIVEIIITAITKRIPEAKSVLSKILATHQIQLHPRIQRLLVPTLNSPNQIAILYDIGKGVKDGKYLLRKPDGLPIAKIGDSVLGFSGDGKSVNGIFAGAKYVWNLHRGIQSFFASNHEPIIPTNV